MTQPIDVESWDCIEDFPQHKLFITTVNSQNIRCELQIDEASLWGQLYNVSENEVLSDETIIDTGEWDYDAINNWIETNLIEIQNENDA